MRHWQWPPRVSRACHAPRGAGTKAQTAFPRATDGRGKGNLVMSHQALLWGVFNLFVVGMLVLDLAVFHRKAHEIRIREALLWSAFWIALRLLFNLGVYYGHGSVK